MFFRKPVPTSTPEAPVITREFSSPFDDETSIGNVLLRMRVVTREQLLTAVGKKAAYDEMLLGALLKELGFCTASDVAKALMLQAKMRGGDPAEAALELMEMRLAAFGAREDALTRAIECQTTAARNRGESKGAWLMSPGLVPSAA